MIELKLYRN